MEIKTVTHTLGLGMTMFVLWLVLSGHFTNPLLLTLGVLSCIVTVVIALRLDVVDHEAVPLQLSLGWFSYIAWLGKEMVKSNLHVARVVLSPSMPINPKIVRTRILQKTEVGQVIYANSITLTPGTVSIEFENDEIVVHAITDQVAHDLASDEMNRRVAAIEAR